MRQGRTLREHLSNVAPSSGRVTETVKEEECRGGLDARARVDDERLQHRHVAVCREGLRGVIEGDEKARYSSGSAEKNAERQGEGCWKVGVRMRSRRTAANTKRRKLGPSKKLNA